MKRRLLTILISILSLIAFVPVVIVLGYMVGYAIVLFLPILIIGGIVALFVR